MSVELKNLFSPLEIGSMTVRNRIVSTAHTTNYGEDNRMGDRYVAYQRRRAQGGVGLIVTEMQGVHITSWDFPQTMFGYDESIVPVYKKLADACHEYGTKVVAQVWHCGRQSDGRYNRMPIWAPSAVPCPASREVPKEMDLDDIKAVVEGFVKVSSNVQEGGLDGVELHGAHGYLLCQFLSGFTNKRTDEYGGSLDNRMRLLLEIVDRVREKVGDDFVVGVRLSAEEFVQDGLNLEESKQIATRLEQTGKIDYLSISGANYASGPLIVGSMHIPLGVFVPLAAEIKQVVDLPIFVANRINDPVQAENILADNQTDMVAMTRALICDPDMPKKAKEGRLEEIRACIGCLQGCVGRLTIQLPVSCLQNPVSGMEREFGDLTPAQERKKVVIVGGGPAGLETARVAAERGHDVVLYEKEDDLGGQINIATKVPNREEFGGIARYLTYEVDRLGVHVHLGVEVTPEIIEAEKPDAVVVATGSVPDVPEIPGAEGNQIVTVWQVLNGEVEVGERVLVVSDDDLQPSCSTADLLAENGKKVEIITRAPGIGRDIGPSENILLLRRLYTNGVNISPFTVIKEISGKDVILRNILTDQETVLEGIDTVVVGVGNTAQNELCKSLKGTVAELYAIGDCVAPRTAMQAIYEGYQVGRSL